MSAATQICLIENAERLALLASRGAHLSVGDIIIDGRHIEVILVDRGKEKRGQERGESGSVHFTDKKI